MTLRLHLGRWCAGMLVASGESSPSVFKEYGTDLAEIKYLNSFRDPER
jgi:hypothetical protein